jgi:hypothetical protein
VINGFARFADAPAAQSLDNFRCGKLEIQNGIKSNAFILQKFLKRFGLNHRTGKAIEDEPAAAVKAAGPFADDVPGGGVGDEIAMLHVS